MAPCFQRSSPKFTTPGSWSWKPSLTSLRHPVPRLSQRRKSIVVSRPRAENGSRNIEAKSSPLQSRSQAPRWWQRTEWWSAGLALARLARRLLQLQLLHRTSIMTEGRELLRLLYAGDLVCAAILLCWPLHASTQACSLHKLHAAGMSQRARSFRSLQSAVLESALRHSAHKCLLLPIALDMQLCHKAT